MTALILIAGVLAIAFVMARSERERLSEQHSDRKWQEHRRSARRAPQPAAVEEWIGSQIPDSYLRLLAELGAEGLATYDDGQHAYDLEFSPMTVESMRSELQHWREIFDVPKGQLPIAFDTLDGYWFLSLSDDSKHTILRLSDPDLPPTISINLAAFITRTSRRNNEYVVQDELSHEAHR